MREASIFLLASSLALRIILSHSVLTSSIGSSEDEIFLASSLALSRIPLALLLADEGDVALKGRFADEVNKERAVELYALASRYPYVANSRWLEDVVGKHITVTAATLPPDVVRVAQERGRARDLEATAAELLAEFVGHQLDAEV